MRVPSSAPALSQWGGAGLPESSAGWSERGDAGMHDDEGHAGLSEHGGVGLSEKGHAGLSENGNVGLSEKGHVGLSENGDAGLSEKGDVGLPDQVEDGHVGLSDEVDAGLPPPQRQLAILHWLQACGCCVEAGAREAAGLGSGGPPLPPASPLSAALPALFADGVLLCQLLAALEMRADPKAPLMAVGGSSSSGGGGSGGVSSGGSSSSGGRPAPTAWLLPGTILPRPGARLPPTAARRNIDTALALLRARPRVAHTHLYL